MNEVMVELDGRVSLGMKKRMYFAIKRLFDVLIGLLGILAINSLVK